MRRPAGLLPAAALLASLAALAGCTTGSAAGPASTPAGPTSSSRSTTPPATTTSAPPHTTAASATPTSPAQVQFATMTLAEKVGQLFMVDCPSTELGAATTIAISRYHVGSVILDGNSQLGVEGTAALVTRLQGVVTRGPKLFVSTDQEGGIVQRLRGSGFSEIPGAVQQGTINPSTLQVNTTVWAGQLRAAGVNVDLGPVLDTVPANSGPNPPIGDLQRQFGSNPATVTSHGIAVVKGLAAAGVDATVKHFPGLGRVSENTDTTSGVSDTVTTRHDAYLAPFAAAIKAKVPFVMIYTRIDPDHPAAFSKTIISGILRGDLGYTGVVISDDLGAAVQVSGYTVAQRAVDFIAAGGDMVLTVNAGQAKAMTEAVIAQAKASPAFAALVNASAMRVLQAKQARGLIS
jgi:beta-N-acetylhexosaminidase